MDTITDPSLEQNSALRPTAFDDFIGQPQIKKQLKILVGGAASRSDALPHMVFHGPHGLGKTTLAHIMARARGVSAKITSGPAMEKPGDVVGLLNSLAQNDILFIDEIHRLPVEVAESLYSAMEDFRIDIMIGQGVEAKTVSLDLPKFTLIGATTQMGKLSPPLQSRFLHAYRMASYSHEDLASIALRSAGLLSLDLSKDAALRLARASRGTPRIVNNLVRWIRDFANNEGKVTADEPMVKDALTLKDIEEDGLDSTDLRILNTLINVFKGGPVGLESLASAAQEDAVTVEENHEPFLLSQGFVQRTPKGRVATELAWKRVGVKTPRKEEALF